MTNDDTRRLGDASNPYVIPLDVQERETRTLGTRLPPPRQPADDKQKDKSK